MFGKIRRLELSAFFEQVNLNKANSVLCYSLETNRIRVDDDEEEENILFF